jgi:hypothetical protein
MAEISWNATGQLSSFVATKKYLKSTILAFGGGIAGNPNH